MNPWSAASRSEQLDFLRTLGCDQYQGYYCSAPMPSDVFNEMMRRQLEVNEPMVGRVPIRSAGFPAHPGLRSVPGLLLQRPHAVRRIQRDDAAAAGSE